MNKPILKRIMVGVSGGVDSSVTLAELQKAGHEVFGVFLRTWQPDWVECTWRDERRDAMRVCAHLEIPFIEVNAEDAYKKGVADYMISEYKAGRTPNPDVMCNRQVKFGHFLDWALEHGADAVATGHYARTVFNKKTDLYELHEAIDKDKDQSYFLWMLTQKDLKHAVFPLGGLVKKETRVLAKKHRLPTATKKDSQGICFLGPIDMKEFLQHEIESVSGNVEDIHGNVIGSHDGALFYTLGERHGFIIHAQSTTAQPYYVVAKDVERNVIVVDHTVRPVEERLELDLLHVNNLSEKIVAGMECEFRYRYHGERLSCVVSNYNAELKTATIAIQQPLLVSPGQSCVFYSGSELLGGGIFS